MAGTAIVMSITAPLVKFFGHGNEGRGYLITMTIYGIAAMCIFFLTFAMQPDVIDYSEYKKNASVAGLIPLAFLVIGFGVWLKRRKA